MFKYLNLSLFNVYFFIFSYLINVLNPSHV